MTAALVEFLLARIDEDEARARSVRRMTPFTPPMPAVWHEGGRHFIGEDAGGFRRELSDDEHAEMIERCSEPADPDPRAMAECESKRQIVGIHSGSHHCEDERTGGTGWVHDFEPCETLRLLALPYAAHSDYLSEWASLSSSSIR